VITGVNRVGIVTDDQAAAKRFWTETVGFELIKDDPYDSSNEAGPRWIEVMPPDKTVVLVLNARKEGQPSTAGHLSHVLFQCDDVEQTGKELMDRGVEFVHEPAKQFWGWSATFKDPDGNLYVLNQRQG
jgi:lactoylglutathione lyase